ncbi:hypothetical protein J1N35_007384, partial [Gossypium stocksii]
MSYRGSVSRRPETNDLQLWEIPTLMKFTNLNARIMFGNLNSHLSRMKACGSLLRTLFSSWYWIRTCGASQKVDRAQLEYEAMWIFKSEEAHRGYVVT